MDNGVALPTYPGMFGGATRHADESRAVYSPAAYLADLLQLVDDNFVDAALTRNRPGLREVPLDPAHTDTEVPYLDVVNDVLTQKLRAELGQDPDPVLRTTQYPFALPFSREDTRRRRLLTEAGAAAEQFYRLFTPHPDADVVAREYLGLSPEEHAVVTTALTTPAQVNAAYGLAATDDLATLAQVGPFLDRTGLAPDLLPGLPGITLDQDGTRLMVGDGDPAWPWFERAARLVRLSEHAAITPADLGLVLATCADGILDAAALRAVAAVRHVAQLTGLTVDVVCSLLAPMGADLFDRTFNGPAAMLDQAVLLGGPTTPDAYAGFSTLTCTGDLLDPHNDAYRRRVALGTGLSEADIAAVVTRFGSAFDGGVGIAALSLLFRISTLARVLELTVPDLLDVLDVLRHDPSLRALDPFDLLVGAGSGEHDPHPILAGGAAADGLWLVQVLVAVGGFLSSSGIPVAQLVAMTGGSQEAGAPALDALAQQFQAVLLTPATFVSDRFPARDAAVVHRAVTAAGGPVSARDARLVRVDADAAAGAAHRALEGLSEITRDDFRDLGIEDRFLEKIFTNLVLRGYLGADGTLVEERFPAQPDGLVLAGDFTAVADQLFDVISQLRLDDAEDTPGADGTEDVRPVVPDPRDPAAFFPSDLEDVEGLPLADDAELYDNLVYQRYLDADGTITQSDFFASDDDADAFVTDADLGDAAPAVWALVTAQVARFDTDPLLFDPTILDDIGLDADAVARLVANLQFNGHLDAAGTYLDKKGLLALGRDRLDVALEFYPVRRLVLEAIQDQITAFRADHHRFPAEAFGEVAASAFAGVVLARLRRRHGVEDHIPDELAALVADGTELGLGPEFGPTEEDAVRQRLAAILAGAQRYRLDLGTGPTAELDADERAGMVAVLQDSGHLTDALLVPRDRVAFFLDVHSALDLFVPGFDDYAKDAFFLLHGIAKETAAATAEITAAVTALAAAQHAALYAGLQDLLGIAPAVVEALCAAVCGTTPDVIDVLVAPILEGADPTGHVTAEPADARFRLTYRRLAEFAAVATALGLDPVQTEIAFRDRGLAGAFPERLALPPGVTTFDALLASGDGQIHLFVGAGCWSYSATTYELLTPTVQPLTALSHRFADLVAVDAAYADGAGAEWLVGHTAARAPQTFSRDGHTAVWERVERTWGAIRNVFTDPARLDTASIDTAFRDREGKTYLFSGDQYVRYSGPDHTVVDPGYPRTIADGWMHEGLAAEQLPDDFARSVDASFQGLDGTTYLFRDGRYLPAPDGSDTAAVAGRWGTVRNAFDGTTRIDANRIDAAYSADGAQFLLRDDQVVRYTDGLEGEGVTVDEGYPVTLTTHFPTLPAGFETGVQAAFTDAAGAVHLFKDGRTVALAPGDGVVTPVPQRWGRLEDVLPSGTVDAAFVGMDGRTYLFSGERYLRYSGSDYSAVDPGYPRAIAPDWGGMRTVTAAFVLDDATFLFGSVGPLLTLCVTDDAWTGFAALLDAGEVPHALRDALTAHGLAPTTTTPVTGAAPQWSLSTDAGAVFTVRRDAPTADPTADPTAVPATPTVSVTGDAERFSVRYSTSDYRTPDAGHPRPMTDDNWWELPADLHRGESALAEVDAVFTGTDRQTYLFAGGQFVVFDNRERWWSAPRQLADDWDSLPFTSVDAAFVGTDGRTYVFSGPRYVRFSGSDYTRHDDRYPNDITTFWGTVPNRIARTGIVDAALVVPATPAPAAQPRRTYLFSGDQYVRYTGDAFDTVDDGYPRCIAASLTAEPGFGHLTAPLDRPIDAALADRGTLSLFTGGRRHVVSDALYRRYDSVLPAAPGCVVVEDGALLVEDGTGWNHVGAIENVPAAGTFPTRTPTRPRSLRGVPDRFRTGLSAVLNAVDGNTYLFRGTSCFDVELGREYPAAQDWGRVRNTVAQRGVVDTGFVGLDGRTYVFSGDQFVAYAGPACVDTDIDGRPQSVAEHWAGLQSVAIAFVEDERTYLCEPADVDGSFRYVVYLGADYTCPEPDCPRTADDDFWGIPAQWGLDRVRAVLVERGHRFLLSGTQYLQHTTATGAWSAPHPLTRLWPGLPFGDDATTAVETAFTGADGATYLFSRGRFVRHDGTQAGPVTPIVDHWGRFPNNFASTTRETLVDAAFVDRGTTTYLFSGDHYVRYSGPDLQWVDDGYPKPVVELRQEDCFANLPDTAVNLLGDRVAAGATTVVDGVAADRRSTALFVDRDCHVVSRSREADDDPGLLGRVRNTLADTGRVDAAFVRDDHTYLFSGDQYVRYTGAAYTVVDEGYPRAIGTALPVEIGVTALPEPFVDGIDAALADADGTVHLFAGREFLTTEPRAAQPTTPQPRPVAGTWGHVHNRFDPASGSTGAVDAAFVAADGRLYAFAGDQYVRYSDPGARLADDGYPRAIKDDWGGLPVAWEAGIDGAFRFEDRTYFLRCAAYVRWSDPDCRRLDRSFPQPVAARWGRFVDYRIADLLAIARFAALHAAHSDADGGLAGVLTGVGPVRDPYQRLAALFGWDVDELAWAVRHRGFLPELSGDIALVSRLVDVFALAASLGGPPSAVYAQAWRPMYLDGAATDPGAGDALQRMLLDRHTPADRVAVASHLHQDLNEAVRDALVAATVEHTAGVHTAADLYDLLLIDVEMGGAGTTSAVREAISAVQLFFQRYFLDLQPVTVRPDGPGAVAVKAELRRRWVWMKNYPVWAANRKVYLYPENYLRPELRTSKTPAFATLENDLHQGDLGVEAVRRAYATYLDSYTEVSRLTIAGGYVREAPPDSDHAWELVLFGRTKTDPRRFHHRRATFSRDASGPAVWQPWAKVDVRIDADRVYPVFAFDRVFVFWTGLEKTANTAPVAGITDKDGGAGDHTYSHDTPATSTVRIYYSFYDLSGTWTPAQQLNTKPVITESLDVSDVKLLVETSAVLPAPGFSDADTPGAVHDNIVVRCSYVVTDPQTDPVKLNGIVRTAAFSLTAELFTQGAAAAGFDDAGDERFAALFDEPVAPVPPFRQLEAAAFAGHQLAAYQVLLAEEARWAAPVIAPPAVVMFNNPTESDTARWFAFDYKGGSFLCKPAAAAVEAPFAVTSLPLAHAGDRLPAGIPIHAGFTTPDGTNHFFDNADHQVVTVDAAGHQGAPHPTGERWGRTTAGFPATGTVDTAFTIGEHTFVVSGSEYARFTGPSLAVMDPGYPRNIRGNPDGLPSWPRIDAAFTGVDGRTYFFQGETYVDGAFPGRRQPIVERFGRRVDGNAAGTQIFETQPVTAALVVGDHTFLIGGGRYVRYTGGEYQFVDAGYPLELAGNPDGLPVSPHPAAITLGDTRYAFDDLTRTYTATAPDGSVGRHVSSDLGGGVLGPQPVIDAACLVGNRLFLVSGTVFLRYTLGADGTVPQYVDAGYPKPCSVPVDALVVLGGAPIVFSGDKYAAVAAGQEMDAPLRLAPIDGSWANLPRGFRHGIDGAIDTHDALYLLRGAQSVRYGKAATNGSAPQFPVTQAGGRFEIVRLTTGTASTLNQRMFAGGVPAVLDVATQETAERPSFDLTTSSATVIKVRPDRVEDQSLPMGEALDFDSANGLYYWEIFFHAPMLIAQSLSAAQRFEEAQTWLEFVFDPTRARDHWRFLPFRETDVEALVDAAAADLAALGHADPGLAAELEQLRTLAPVFRLEREVQEGEDTILRTVPDRVAAAIRVLPAPAVVTSAWPDLQETGAILERLPLRYAVMVGGRRAAVQPYLDDPFDPHAIAALRPGAYKRAAVMAYLDNLLEWGDSLFRQFTGESVDQARMLYLYARDLLGPRPVDLGARPLRDVQNFGQLTHTIGEYDFLLQRAAATPASGTAVVHASIAVDPDDPDGGSYFTIPENAQLAGYWTRVDDSLRKIRSSLDFLGVARRLALFDPPLDPMALVRATASGAGLDSVALAIPVTAPPYRFAFMLAKAQELTDRLAQFGGDLLAALEKRDAEALTLLQTRNDGGILALTRAVREAAVGAATATVAELAVTQQAAQQRQAHYQALIDGGRLDVEIAQLVLMGESVEANVVASVLKLGSGIAHIFPQMKIGLFNFGEEFGGDQAGSALDKMADFAQTLGATFSGAAEILGMQSAFQRTTQEWQLQLQIATNDVAQIAAQQDGAAHQLESARHDLAVADQDIANNAEVARFLTAKFGTQQLYDWMAGQLSGVYLQAYGMAHDLARQAELALRFERGLPADAPIIQPAYWDGQHRGLVAAERLSVDLLRLVAAQRDSGERGLEITKRISLLDLDPMALLRLRATGTTEFALTEAVFDHDFPGHHRRQIRTLAVALLGPDGPVAANAVLTQLQHKTVLAPDAKAVKHLLDGQGVPPASVRADWRPTQQIALSTVPDGQDNNGLFELRYDDDRYLPFEGTGAVSTWRLELPGQHVGYTTAGLSDVVLTLRYTAVAGDAAFTTAVKGMLRPYVAYRYLDIAQAFPDAWDSFLAGDAADLAFTVTPDLFPGMASRQISAVYPRIDAGQGGATAVLNGNPAWRLTSDRLLPTGGLTVSAAGSAWSLAVDGDPGRLRGVELVLTYLAQIR